MCADELVIPEGSRKATFFAQRKKDSLFHRPFYKFFQKIQRGNHLLIKTNKVTLSIFN